MLRRAQARVAEFGLHNVEGLAVMDAEHLGFPDCSFDAVVAQYVITTVPDPEATLDEFARVLKPGGEIILVSRVGAEAGLRRAFEHWFTRDGAPARLALGISLGTVCALGRGSARRAPGRTPHHAAARAFLAGAICQVRRGNKTNEPAAGAWPLTDSPDGVDRRQ
jgi:SAM-dependent methyltransferase